MFSLKCESKLSTMFGAVAVMVIVAAVAVFALAGCSGSAGGGGADQKEEATGGAAVVDQKEEAAGGAVATDLKEGSSITLGSYEQDGNLSNGPEPIEWRVLSVKDGEALLVSEYALSDNSNHFNYANQSNDWETSELKSWLENEFAGEAFDSDDKQRIIEVTCLSTEEAESYFSSDDDRVCLRTEYANGDKQNRNCAWWLRSPGSKSDYACAAYVGPRGEIDANGQSVDSSMSVRPALRVML